MDQAPEREASIRSDFRQCWQVVTEHFEIHTNYSLEQGVDLGRALEDFHDFFVREFAAFFNTKQQMQAMFKDGSTARRGDAAAHDLLLRTRNEYVIALKPKQSNIEIAGMTVPAPWRRTPTSTMIRRTRRHSRHDVPRSDPPVARESAKSITDVGQNANFWVIEGIACYMESFRRDEGRFTVGDPLHRASTGSARLLNDRFFIPMAKLTSLGRMNFSVDSISRRWQAYSQVSGMVHFFSHCAERSVSRGIH
ncbi:MAG: hypothetical protein U0992_09995 [Planctomycetaceae bacterium]